MALKKIYAIFRMFSDYDDLLPGDPGDGDQEGADNLPGAEPEPAADSQGSLMSDLDESSKADSLASKMSSTDSVGGSEILAAFNRDTVNKALAALNVSPVSKKKLSEKDYPNQKIKEVTEAVRSKLNIQAGENNDCQDIIEEGF